MYAHMYHSIAYRDFTEITNFFVSLLQVSPRRNVVHVSDIKQMRGYVDVNSADIFKYRCYYRSLETFLGAFDNVASDCIFVYIIHG